MITVLRSLLVCLALVSLAIPGIACGGSDTAEETVGGAADGAASEAPAGKEEEEATDNSLKSPEAAEMMAKYREMAASEGIYFGEVPEGFPLDFIPLHPDGEIDKSSTGDGDFTLLQNVPVDKDTAFAWFKDFYGDLGWTVGDPFTMGNRTMTGIDGNGGEVSMTMISQDDGSTFVALVLSPR